MSDFRIGIISDTHGLMRQEALAALAGSDFIVHAGDIGNLDIVQALQSIAPLTAVRGNNDTGAWAARFASTATLRAGDTCLYVLHDIADLGLDPAAAGFHVVVSGHSHKPRIEERGGVVYVNPGSAGPRRFKLPVSVATLEISGVAIRPTIVVLDLAAPPRLP